MKTQADSFISRVVAAGARPTRPWLHVTVSPRVAQFLIAAGARPAPAQRSENLGGADTGQRGRTAGSVSQLPWIPPKKFRYLHGRPHPVSTEAMFPYGCRLEPGEISEAPVPALDGEQAAQCWVVDLNPAPYLKDRAHDTVVNIIPASNKPDVKDWPRFALVQFEGLEVIPYETEQDVAHGQMEYVLRAKGVRLAP